MSDADRERLFLENAAKAAAGTHSVSDTGDLLAALGRVVAMDSPVYCPGVTELEKAAASLFPVRAADYAAAAVTVEEVFGAIAETGTIVCVSAGGRAVQAGLLPAHHVAIVRRERIFETLDDLFAAVLRRPAHEHDPRHGTQPDRRHRAHPGDRRARPGEARHHPGLALARPSDREVGDVGAGRSGDDEVPERPEEGIGVVVLQMRAGIEPKGRGACDGGAVGVRPRGVGGPVDPVRSRGQDGHRLLAGQFHRRGEGELLVPPPLPLPRTFTVVSPPAITATACPGESASAAFRNRAQKERAHSLASPRRKPGRRTIAVGPAPGSRAIRSAAASIAVRFVPTSAEVVPRKAGSSGFGVSGRAPAAPSARCRRTGEGTA